MAAEQATSKSQNPPRDSEERASPKQPMLQQTILQRNRLGLWRRPRRSRSSRSREMRSSIRPPQIHPRPTKRAKVWSRQLGSSKNRAPWKRRTTKYHRASKTTLGCRLYWLQEQHAKRKANQTLTAANSVYELWSGPSTACGDAGIGLGRRRAQVRFRSSP